MHEQHVQRCNTLYVSSFACFTFTEMNNQTVFLWPRRNVMLKQHWGIFISLQPPTTQQLMYRTIYFSSEYPRDKKRANFSMIKCLGTFIYRFSQKLLT